MISPWNVSQRKFQVLRVLYRYNGYSIAWGTWEGRSNRIGQRWDGEGEEGDNQVGYPSQGGHPTWMMMDEHLHLPYLCSLLTSPHLTDEMVADIRQTITEIRTQP